MQERLTSGLAGCLSKMSCKDYSDRFNRFEGFKTLLCPKGLKSKLFGYGLLDCGNCASLLPAFLLSVEACL